VQRRIEDKLDVNAWRSLFLVNELNEIQSYKIINTNLTLFLYGLVMEGFGIRYWTNHDPDFVAHKTNSEESWVIFFFVSTLVMYTIAFIQYGGRYAIKKWFPLKTEEFTDLCSVTNISVLIFDDSFGGYYIHGRSPYGYTELSTEKLRRHLEKEARGQGQIRGLSPENPDL
jgi:meckelin